mgnify:CR=1 FL=1|jgi:hypothetical protein
MAKRRAENKGQVIAVFAVSLLALLFFVGLALDAGSVYVTYGSLKRTVDSASIAAANEFKREANVSMMTEAAEEIFNLLNVDQVTVIVRLCDEDQDGNRDTDLQTTYPEFYARCPDTASGDAPRKLVYVRATQEAPLYFLSLMGFTNIPLTTYTISEAAPLDVVIVLDTSESMASATTGYSPFDDFDPNACNSANNCQPMRDAKDAAKALIDTLADGYDQVAVVTFDDESHLIYPLGLGLDAAKTAIDGIGVRNDPPVVFRIWPTWYDHAGSYNPMNSEDLDGDGEDYDNPARLGYTCPFAGNPASDPAYLQDRWWSVDEGGPDTFGWGGVPCDRDDRFDSMDWNSDGIWTQDDHDIGFTWATMDTVAPNQPEDYHFTGLSTCSGCGLRQGSNQLRNGGRFGAVWVMVFLSDGAVNLSDVHASNEDISSALVNGFCGGEMSEDFWASGCRDFTFTPRYCFDDNASTCPPGSTYTTTTPNYSVLDYARDMVDSASLTRSTNTNEPNGNDIAIYSIGLNVDGGIAEQFLRYVAAVGDDGDRTTDPCSAAAANTSCGQYYFAPSGAHLRTIFEDIATRIYTRISQ